MKNRHPEKENRREKEEVGRETLGENHAQNSLAIIQSSFMGGNG
jgi:hypothetical protein